MRYSTVIEGTHINVAELEAVIKGIKNLIAYASRNHKVIQLIDSRVEYRWIAQERYKRSKIVESVVAKPHADLKLVPVVLVVTEFRIFGTTLTKMPPDMT